MRASPFSTFSFMKRDQSGFFDDPAQKCRQVQIWLLHWVLKPYDKMQKNVLIRKLVARAVIKD